MATYISKGNGDWTSRTTWLTAAAGFTPTGDAGAPPQSGARDKFVIRGGHVVTYNDIGIYGDGDDGLVGINPTISSGSIILSGGTLRASRAQNTALTAVGTIFVAGGASTAIGGANGNNSFLDWGTLNDPISNVTTSISLSSSVAGGAAIFVGNGSTTVSNNSACFCGLEKTRNTFLTLSAAAGQAVINVDSCTNWATNDLIVIESDNTVVTRTLSARIQSIDIPNKQVTLNGPLNFARLSGTRVGNFTSSVTIKTLEGYPLPQCGLTLLGGRKAIYQVSNVTFENLTNRWARTDQAGQTVILVAGDYGALRYEAGFNEINAVLRKLAFINTTTPSSVVPLIINDTPAQEVLVDEIAMLSTTTTTPIGFKGSTIARLINSVVYRSEEAFQDSSYRLTIENCFFNGNNSVFDTSVMSGRNLSIINSRLRSGGPACLYHNTGSLTNISLCNLVYPNFLFANDNNSFGDITITDCTITNPVSSYTFSTANKTVPEASINVFNPNNNNTFTSFNYFYHLSANPTLRRNGVTSMMFRPKVPSSSFSKLFKIPAIQGVTQKFKGNIRFDGNYGTSTPPSIRLGNSVPTTTFTCPAVIDTWHSFELDVTPTFTDDIYLTITGMSNLSTGYVYFDGIPLDPFIKDVRWYGFQVDKNAFRTIDTYTTLTENRVSAYPYVNNLDFLYDECRYWTVTNPSVSSYIDLVENLGKTINFSNRGLVLNSSALSPFSFNSTTNIVTLSTFSLSAGNNFNAIQTTGGVTIDDNSVISNISFIGNVSATNPKNLNAVVIDGTLTYNTNSSDVITYTDSNIRRVENNGSGIVTINRLNTVVGQAGRNVTLLDNPTYINIININGGYVAIYDNNDILRYYRNTDGQIILPNGSSGIWTYKVAKYGFKTIIATFSTGTTVNIIPPYAQNIDTNILETNVSLVSTYTTFDNTQNIYDYFSYYRTTSSGITYPQFYAYRNSLDILNNNLILNPIASIPFSYDGSTFTLKTTKIQNGLLVKGIETTNNIYLSGSASLSSIDIKSNTLRLESVFDLNSVNAESNIIYNTDNEFDIYYTNCNINKVENIGNGDIRIKKLNSIIIDGSDPQIFDFYPTYLNLNLNLGTIGIYDNSLPPVRKYFTSTNQTIELPYEADGLWTYRITRYGQRTVEGNFTVNRDIGGFVNITPTFQPDIYVYSPLSIVSAYNTFSTIQSIYDYMSFYKTTSNGIDYGDLTNVGSILDILNNRSLILDITSPSLLSITTNSIKISSDSLSSGVGYAVNSIKTTNNIYLSGNSTLQSMTVQGNIYQQNISNLLGMVVDGTFRYYVNTPTSITYTNCNVNTVVNDGDKLVTITRINSFISDATDAEISTIVPISINIDVDSTDTYVAIYKPNGDRYYYNAGDKTLILGGDAVTGNWSYKAVRYGYMISTGSFYIDKDISSVSTISPTLFVDSSITVSNVNTVSSYTDLNTHRKIYDYLSYFKTTIDGIDFGDIASRAFGAIIINKGLILNQNSATMVSVNSNDLTIKTSKIDEDVTIYSSGDFVLLNGSEISDKVRIRASNMNSELIVIGITELILYPSLEARDKDISRGTIITGNIFRFKYDTIVDGVLLKDILYVRAKVGSYLLSTFPISEGNNVVDLGTFGQIQQVLFNQSIINEGVKKSSRLIPHSTDL